MTSVAALLRRRKPNLYLYGDESGALRGDRFFMLGLLKTRDPGKHEQQIYALRNRKGFHAELKYSSSNVYKVGLAKAVIDYFWSEADLTFTAFIIDTSKHKLSEFSKYRTRRRPEDTAYNYWYKRLILWCTPPKDPLVIYLDNRTRAKEDNLPEYLRREIPHLKDLQLVDSSKHQLVQVADLFTGSIYGEATGVRHKVKRELIEYIRERTRAPNLLSLRRNPKFCVRPAPLSE